MSELAKLLDGVEVEWKALGEVAGVFDGTHQTPKYTEDGVPFVSVQNIKNLYSTEKYISFEDFEKYKYKPQKGDVFMTRIGDIGTCAIVRDNKPLAYYVTLTLIRVNQACILPKFLKYIIESNIGQEELYKRTLVHATPIKINLGEIGKIIIPIPPLSIQKEIVRILDTFTERTDTLINELTIELEARKKQYNYYREQLLNSSEFKIEKLEDIAKIYLGLTYTPTYVDSGIKFISAQNTSSDFLDLSNVKHISEEEFQNSTSNAKPKRGDVIFTRVGSNLGHPVIVETDEPLCIFVSLGFIRVKQEKVLNSYIKHWMKTELFWEQVKRNTYGAAKINLNTGWLNKFEVLLPSLEEQSRIVSILDKLESLTASISEALPKEIALRKKQYEYYRDLLLTFPNDNIKA